MTTISLVAQRAFPYAGRSIVAGQIFIAQSEHDASVLKMIGHAIDAPPYQDDVLGPPSEEPDTDSSPVVTPKRQYRRRVVEVPRDAD